MVAQACGFGTSHLCRTSLNFLHCSSLSLVLLLPWGKGGESAVAAPNSVSLRHDGGRTGGDDSTSFNIDDAPFGFFVDGSSIVAANGIHGPRLGAGSSELPPLLAPQVRLGLYLHASGSGWVLANLNRKVVSGSAVARGDEGRTISEWLFIDPGGRERFSYRPGDYVVPGFGDAWIHCAFERAHGAAHSIQTVGDAMELPWLLAPIPGDRNGRTSHFFEQLLVQWRRQRSAEEAADQRMRQPRPPTCGSGSSDEQNPDDHNRAPAAARLARAQAFLDAGRAADALVTFETLLPDVNDNEGSAAGQHKQAEAEGGDVGTITKSQLLPWLVAASAAVARLKAASKDQHNYNRGKGCELLRVGPHLATWYHTT